MSELPVSGMCRLRARLIIVDYDLLSTLNGKTIKIGGGFTKIEASNGDSMVKQMNRILDGRRYKISQVTPVT